MHAKDVLNNARILNDLNELDVDLKVGTTAVRAENEYNLRRNHLGPEQLASRVSRMSGSLGLIFGREDNGLSNEELDLCDLTVSISSNPEYPTLNITHAAGILFYHLFMNDGFEEIAAPSRNVLDKLYEVSDDWVAELDLNREDTFKFLMRRVWGRGLNAREAHGIIGLLKESLRKMKSER